MAFFSDTITIKEYCSINISSDFSDLNVFLKQADRDFIIKNIGSSFFNYLQNIYDTTAYGSIAATPKNAIEKLRLVSASYALALWVPSGQLQIDASGIRIANTDNLKTAFQWQIKDLIKSLYLAANSAMEDALKFFADNTGLYPQFAAAPEFTYFKESFIQTADEFTKYYSQLGGSRMNFVRLRSCMAKAEEQDIKAVLFDQYYSILKSNIISSTPSLADLNVLPFIKKAVANLTIARAINEMAASFDGNGFLVFDNTHSSEVIDGKKSANHEALSRLQEYATADARVYLSDLRKYLEANKGAYPNYTGDPNYKTYESESFLNKVENNYFYGG